MRRGLIALALTVASLPARAQNLDTVTVRTARVGEGVYMLTGAGGNIGAEFDATWGNPFITPDRFVEAVYTSLSRR